MTNAQPWGRLHPPGAAVVSPVWRGQVPALMRSAEGYLLPFGLGRSYGDVCTITGGRLLDSRGLDRLIFADWKQGVLRAEAGLSIDDLLHLTVPRGWFIPVTPGTRRVTLGGAVANDVHGKNHSHAGTFGRHVTAIGLTRSDQGDIELTPSDTTGLFAATIGGLGLTGFITWVQIQLEPITSAYLDTETLAIPGLDDYFRIAGQSRDWPFSVAWVDCLAGGHQLGRGLFTRARWSTSGSLTPHSERQILSMPLDAPEFLLNRYSIGAFNYLYRRRPGALGKALTHYASFFHPLDSIGSWNRLYGRRGFFQHQSVIPRSEAPATLRRMLGLTSERGLGSFLIVIKEFGSVQSPGAISFPMEGTTFALDFANRGTNTEAMIRDLAEIATAAGGRIYPAKDARMTAAQFRAGYPSWEKVEHHRDPRILSDFWRRTALGR